MARSSHKVRDLAEQIESLEPEERMELLRRVVTPELELRLLVEDLQQKVRVTDPRALAQDINRTVREVRSLGKRDLSDIAGTWHEDPEFDQAVVDQNRVDESQ